MCLYCIWGMSFVVGKNSEKNRKIKSKKRKAHVTCKPTFKNVMWCFRIHLKIFYHLLCIGPYQSFAYFIRKIFTRSYEQILQVRDSLSRECRRPIRAHIATRWLIWHLRLNLLTLNSRVILSPKWFLWSAVCHVLCTYQIYGVILSSEIVSCSSFSWSALESKILLNFTMC